MSTNKTENYGLHAWAAGDDFSREEINVNFALMDAVAAGKVGMISGSYKGTAGTAVRVELGCRPLAVHIEALSGIRHGSTTYGGLYPDGGVSTAVTIDNAGFTVNERYMQSYCVYAAYVRDRE